MWFISDLWRKRIRVRKPKVSRLFGDEAERVIGRPQWTVSDIVYTSNPIGVVRFEQEKIKRKEVGIGYNYLLYFFSFYQRKKFPPKFEYFVNRTSRIVHVYRTINPIGLKKQVLGFFLIFPATCCHGLRFLFSFTRRSFLFPILVLWYHTQEY